MTLFIQWAPPVVILFFAVMAFAVAGAHAEEKKIGSARAEFLIGLALLVLAIVLIRWIP